MNHVRLKKFVRAFGEAFIKILQKYEYQIKMEAL